MIVSTQQEKTENSVLQVACINKSPHLVEELTKNAVFYKQKEFPIPKFLITP